MARHCDLMRWPLQAQEAMHAELRLTSRPVSCFFQP
jgi:hypothetical protein